MWQGGRQTIDNEEPLAYMYSLPTHLPHGAVPNPSFDWREIPEALRLLDDGGVSAISSYIFIDGVRGCCWQMDPRSERRKGGVLDLTG